MTNFDVYAGFVSLIGILHIISLGFFFWSSCGINIVQNPSSLGIQPLLTLLDSEFAVIQQLALESLGHITLDGT